MGVGRMNSKSKMYIVIKKDASEIYVKNNTHYGFGFVGNPEWVKTLKLLEGKTMEVDTEYLFKDQFNVKRLEDVPYQYDNRGCNCTGYRIMGESVARVINDKRKGAYRCAWCGKPSRPRKHTDLCPKCKKKGHMEKLW